MNYPTVCNCGFNTMNPDRATTHAGLAVEFSCECGYYEHICLREFNRDNEYCRECDRCDKILMPHSNTFVIEEMNFEIGMLAFHYRDDEERHTYVEYPIAHPNGQIAFDRHYGDNYDEIARIAGVFLALRKRFQDSK